MLNILSVTVDKRIVINLGNISKEYYSPGLNVLFFNQCIRYLFFQTPHGRHLSPGSGQFLVTARHGWSPPGHSNRRLLAHGGHLGGSSGSSSMASTPEDEDSGRGSRCHNHQHHRASGSGQLVTVTSGRETESLVTKHIDRNILACQICLHRYKEPKVSRTILSLALNAMRLTYNTISVTLSISPIPRFCLAFTPSALAVSPPICPLRA